MKEWDCTAKGTISIKRKPIEGEKTSAKYTFSERFLFKICKDHLSSKNPNNPV